MKKRKGYESGGAVERGYEPQRRSIYGEMDVSATARQAVEADRKAYQAADPAERARLDEARKRTPGYKRGGVVRKKK
jgi:hypothetical protein